MDKASGCLREAPRSFLFLEPLVAFFAPSKARSAPPDSVLATLFDLSWKFCFEDSSVLGSTRE